LDKIIINTDCYNIFKNTNVKNILLYNPNLNILTQVDNSSEIDSIVIQNLQDQKSVRSEYNNLLEDQKFLDMLQQSNLILESDQKRLNQNLKSTSEMKSLEEKILFYQALDQKNDFIIFLKKYLSYLAKNDLVYRLIDYLMFYFKFNNKNLFSILVKLIILKL